MVIYKVHKCITIKILVKRYFFNVFFLVIDENSLTELGRRHMAGMLTRPCTITSVDFTIPTVLREISENALLVIDNHKLEHLVTAVEAAVNGGYVKRLGVILFKKTF